MIEVIEEKKVEIIENASIKYVKLNYSDVKKESDELIKQNFEAYKTLANA